MTGVPMITTFVAGTLRPFNSFSILLHLEKDLSPEQLVTIKPIAMGVGRISSRGGGSEGFSQNFFQKGAKSGEICLLPLEIEKTIFFC